MKDKLLVFFSHILESKVQNMNFAKLKESFTDERKRKNYIIDKRRKIELHENNEELIFFISNLT